LSTVPNVVGQPAEQAEAELWNALFASTLVTVPSNKPEGTVVSTDPPAGTRADWRAITVTVNVSGGPPERTQPDRGGDGNNGGAQARKGPGGGAKEGEEGPKEGGKGGAKEGAGDRGEGRGKGKND
jgi:hypothetical protein